MKKKQARSDAERDSKARKPTMPRRVAAALITGGLMLSPNTTYARAPSTQPPTMQSTVSSPTGEPNILTPRPAPIQYAEAFRDVNFTCEIGDGMVRISGNVEGGEVEFPVPLDLGEVRGVFRTGSSIRLLSENYLIVSRADGSSATNISLPQAAQGAGLRAWLSTENMFYILSSDGEIHATSPEDAECPWYSGGPFRTVEGAKLIEARGLLAIVQGSDTAVVLVKVVPGGTWDSLSVRLNFQPEGEPSVSITELQLRITFRNCEVVLDIPSKGEISSVVPIVVRY
jgi:hypothetical protein